MAWTLFSIGLGLYLGWVASKRRYSVWRTVAFITFWNIIYVLARLTIDYATSGWRSIPL